jgi:predicted TIM-barrel fold metal-dependent hydrolase
MVGWQDALRPSGWKCYTLWGPPTKAAPDGGWFLDDEEVGFPFLERVRALGPRVIATHKGISGPIDGAAANAGSPRDIGPASAAFPDLAFVVYHSGYEPDLDAEEGRYDAGREPRGTDRLVRSLEDAGVGPGRNVFAELGTTWFLMLRRPAEAAHVLGKLLRAVGPDNIVWGTDSIWYGSPQHLIDAFRAFQIPASFQERYGYPALTAEVKDRIMSRNARGVYGVSDEQVTRAAAQSPAWVTNAAAEVRKAVDAARNL